MNIRMQIFAKMTPYDLGKAACVCQKWEYAVHDPVFWRNACLKDWQVNYLLVINLFSFSI